MARVRGIVNFNGKIGDLVFYTKNGEQYVKLAGDRNENRKKAFNKNKKCVSTNRNRLGINYFATSLYRLMKSSGLTLGQRQFNIFKNELHSRMHFKYEPGRPILASTVKEMIHGYEWRNNQHGPPLYVTYRDDGISIENLASEVRSLNHKEKYQINIYRIILKDVLWNGEKYAYTLPKTPPAYLQQEWICTKDQTTFEIEITPLAANEFMVMSILPMIEEHYAVQSGARLWIF
ncbi:MAG: hypothetical protein H6599_02385 [Flavobacteriales bacterium]|nr:hypothetical protein [Flavobacteriales bacterium]